MILYAVSVSFRSYLFSNFHFMGYGNNRFEVSVSFRSYLFSNKMKRREIEITIVEFPSPFGVICSLINGIIYYFQIPVLIVSVSFRSYLFSNPHMRKGSFYKKFFGYFRVNFQNFYFFQFLNKKTC